MTTVPDLPRRSGQARTNMSAAWSAAWSALEGDTQADRRDLILVMQRASPISHRTAREILIAAVDNGSLKVVSRDRFGRPTLRRP